MTLDNQHNELQVRFLEFPIDIPGLVYLVIDLETGIEYLKSAYYYQPLLTGEATLKKNTFFVYQTDLIDQEKLSSFKEKAKKRFVLKTVGANRLLPTQVMIDSETGIEYFITNHAIAPVLTEEGLPKSE